LTRGYLGNLGPGVDGGRDMAGMISRIEGSGGQHSPRQFRQSARARVGVLEPLKHGRRRRSGHGAPRPGGHLGGRRDDFPGSTYHSVLDTSHSHVMIVTYLGGVEVDFRHGTPKIPPNAIIAVHANNSGADMLREHSITAARCARTAPFVDLKEHPIPQRVTIAYSCRSPSSWVDRPSAS